MTDFTRLAGDINALDFDDVFTITDDGKVKSVKGVHAPDVYHDDENDITIDGDKWWGAYTRNTGQYSYSGAVMHNSESVGSRIAERLFDDRNTFVFALANVYVLPDNDSEEINVAGWAIMYRDK